MLSGAVAAMGSQRNVYFATCAPGVEPLLLAEARALRLGRVEAQVGGVRFEGTRDDARRANLWMRTAVRVLERLTRFPARDERELYEGARAVDWRRWLDPRGTLVVDARSKESALSHTRFVEQRVKDAVVDSLRTDAGQRPSVDKEEPDLRVDVHVWRDRVTLSADTSGASLHRRGWRVHQGPAPLAETTAAAVVLASGWDRRSPLVDPFCGSGTILVEAAWIAGGVAPGLLRTFGFERWPDHDERAWSRLKDEARARARHPARLQLVGRDRSPEQIEGARANLARADLADRVRLEVGDAAELDWRPGWNAWVVTNPPYGERVGDVRALETTYAELGRRLRERAAGYRVVVLSGNAALTARLGLDFTGEMALTNGGLPCVLLRT